MLSKNALDPLLRGLSSDEELADYYRTYSDILVAGVQELGREGIMMDLDSLPTEPYPLKKVFLMWLMAVNKDRFKRLLPPIITYELVMQCPLWKFMAPPFRRVPMTKDALLGLKSINQKPSGGRINKSRRR